MGVSVGGPSRGDSVEGGFHGAVSDSVDVNDEALLVGVAAEFGKLAGVKEQVTIVAGVLIWLGEMRRLGRKFGDSVGEDFDAGYMEMRDILIPLARFLDGG